MTNLNKVGRVGVCIFSYENIGKLVKMFNSNYFVIKLPLKVFLKHSLTPSLSKANLTKPRKLLNPELSEAN